MIQFNLDGKRKTLRIGKCNKQGAASVLSKVELILSLKALGRPVTPEVVEWVDTGTVSGSVTNWRDYAYRLRPTRLMQKALHSVFCCISKIFLLNTVFHGGFSQRFENFRKSPVYPR